MAQRSIFRRSHRHQAALRTVSDSGMLGLVIFIGLLLSVDAANSRDHNKNVVGYFTQWDQWKGPDAGVVAGGALNHLNIAMENYDIINFSFLGVARDGSMHSADVRNREIYMNGAVQEPGPLIHPDMTASWDPFVLWGEVEAIHHVSYSAIHDPNDPDMELKQRIADQGIEYTNDPPRWEHVASGVSGDFPIPVRKVGGAQGLIEYAHMHGTKVMAAIGGWAMCKHFPEVARDEVKRARFVEDALRLIEMGFDGIDLDWEYPGAPGMNIENYGLDDYDNFLTLVKDLRQAIGSDKLITAAFAGQRSKLENYDWVELGKYMDYYNMMTYDYAGGWSERTGHNSPLFDYDSSEDSTSNIESLYQWMVVDQGIPAEKINMGVAFYGRSVQTGPPSGLNVPTVKRAVVSDPDGPVSSALDDDNFRAYGGVPYYNIIDQAKDNGWTEHWDDQAKVPYLTKDVGNMGYFVSYDNERSVRLKGEFIHENRLGGVIVWTAQGEIDCVGVPEQPAKMPICDGLNPRLSNALNDGLAGFSSGTQGGPALEPDIASPPSASVSISFSSIGVDESSPSSASASATPPGSGGTSESSGASNPAQAGPAPISASVSSQKSTGAGSSSCAGINVYPNWTAKNWEGEPDHAVGGDVMVNEGKVYEAKWWTKSVPGSDASWVFEKDCP